MTVDYGPLSNARIKTVRRRAMIARLERMVDLALTLNPPDKLAFDVWDKKRPAAKRTSEWPGFATVGLPPLEEFVAFELTQAYVRRFVPDSVRAAIFCRDEYRCRQCPADIHLTIDHIYPIAKGGDSHPDNLQTLCMTCNAKKGSR